ncbi:MAG: hypothetical protein SangKO_013090 [Sandaracinaceae bacterium]
MSDTSVRVWVPPHVAGDKYGSRWAVLNGSGRVPHPHPLGRSADNFDFLIFSQTTFPAMLPSAEWDIGRVLN